MAPKKGSCTFVVKDLSLTSAELLIKRGSESSLYTRFKTLMAIHTSIWANPLSSTAQAKSLTTLTEPQILHLCRLRGRNYLHHIGSNSTCQRALLQR